jgi:hypothetical protein
MVRLQGTPEAIARGLASGILVGCMPLYGLQTLLSIVLAILIRGNKLVAIAGTWISNPLTDVPLFVLNYQIGRSLLAIEHPEHTSGLENQSWLVLLEMGRQIFQAALLGGVLTGTGAAAISYFAGRSLVRRFRQQKIQRRGIKNLAKKNQHALF